MFAWRWERCVVRAFGPFFDRRSQSHAIPFTQVSQARVLFYNTFQFFGVSLFQIGDVRAEGVFLREQVSLALRVALRYRVHQKSFQLFVLRL